MGPKPRTVATSMYTVLKAFKRDNKTVK